MFRKALRSLILWAIRDDLRVEIRQNIRVNNDALPAMLRDIQHRRG